MILELLERIKTIRVSERMSYQKITDLFIATSTDYNPKSEEAYTFFKIVQNKLHYAISGYKYDVSVANIMLQ